MHLLGCLRNFISICFSSEKKKSQHDDACWRQKSKWTSRDRHYTWKESFYNVISTIQSGHIFLKQSSFKSDWDEAGFLSSKVHSQKENTDVLRGTKKGNRVSSLFLSFPKSTFQTSFRTFLFPSVWDSRAKWTCVLSSLHQTKAQYTQHSTIYWAWPGPFLKSLLTQ